MTSPSSSVATRGFSVALIVVLVALYLTPSYPVAAGLVAAAGLAGLWLAVVATCLGFAVLTQRSS